MRHAFPRIWEGPGGRRLLGAEIARMSEIQVGELDSRIVNEARSSKAAVSVTAIVAGMALAKLLLQFAGMRHYGFFRDELYYMACGEHLAWGYVDQPPLIAFVAWFARHVFGSSLVSIRLLPALAGAGLALGSNECFKREDR